MQKLFSSYNKRGYKIDKNGKEVTKNISYKLQLIDRARLMAVSDCERLNTKALTLT